VIRRPNDYARKHLPCRTQLVCNLLALPSPVALEHVGWSADYKSAIQQTASLRYDALAPNTSLDLCPDALRKTSRLKVTALGI
jgi:hypothetical protein